MQVLGLTPRPTLKGRASFYDLVKKRNIDQLSAATAKLAEGQPELVAFKVPLPLSPTRQQENLVSPPPTPALAVLPELPEALEEQQPTVKMAPVSFQCL